ncbi:glycosyltransferase family 4 protein [Cohnella ginsengisoli]|uniref:Glycosyltransferase family 4 protein n=1 Tax=Cohnella ginsengisoli TaxID=425004 RepID=A0A9X4QLZ8_9BACL|nr:glycosyltransferase family 4 protein [Cohnella ginsengisoli]MDG0790597.1 glycosyltransferase family 4 protein [Cohnella ginsengisoli]
MRAAFVTPGAYPVPAPRGGSVERVVENFVPLLADNLEVRIYGRTAKGLPRRGMLHGARCERVRAPGRRAYLSGVVAGLRVYRPQLIEVENRPRMVPLLKRKFPGARVWLHLHSNTFISGKAISPRELQECLGAADRILVNSFFLKADVERRSPRVASKLGVVYPGVDPARFGRPTVRETIRSAHGWQHRQIVLFAGRLIPLKGVHHLIAALPALIRRHPNVLLVIVGSPFYGSSRTSAYSRKLLRMARPWRRYVHFEPYASHDQMPAWFSMADVAVVPSVRREAFGLVNVEAMASGLPVVACRVGGMTEIVEDGVTGFLVDPRRLDAELPARISLLLEDEALRTRMGALGRERVVERFTWRHTAERWLAELYRDLEAAGEKE